MADYPTPTKGVSKTAEVANPTREVGGTGDSYPAGVFRHPGSGEEAITVADPLTGDAQSRAFVRAGFEYVRPATKEDVANPLQPSADYAEKPGRAVEQQDAYNKGLEARLAALESQNDRLRAKVATGNDVPGVEAVKGSDATKQAAADRVEDQTGVQVDVNGTGDKVTNKDSK